MSAANPAQDLLRTAKLFSCGSHFTLKVGDRVGFSGTHEHHYGCGTVARITPSGQIILEDGKRFNAQGRRITDKNSPSYVTKLTLIPAERFDEIMADKTEQRGRNERVRAFRNAADTLFNGRRTGYGDYSEITAEEKAALAALLAAI